MTFRKNCHIASSTEFVVVPRIEATYFIVRLGYVVVVVPKRVNKMSGTLAFFFLIFYY